MSSHDEIMAVFYGEIEDKTHKLISKHGMATMLEGTTNMHVFNMFDKPRGDGNTVTDLRIPQAKDEDYD